MATEFDAALQALERKLNDSEQTARGLRVAINALLELKGEKPRFPPDGGGSGGGGLAATDDGGSTGAAGALTAIKGDSFFGKKLSTAMREFLTMVRAKGGGPATPREIFEALRRGGYKFETKSDEIALVNIRAMLRKNTPTFVKVGNGYGLTAWYPDMKKPRVAAGGAAASHDDDEEDLSDEADAEDDEAA